MKTSARISNGKKRFLWMMIAAPLLVCASALLAPRPVYGQFDLGAIIPMLTAIQSTINSTIMPVLTSLNSVSANMMQFQQTVEYPASQIQMAQEMAGVNRGEMTSMQRMFSSPYNSAILSNTQTLESHLLGGNANNISGLNSQYYGVYGSLPASTTVNSTIRTVVDANDAEAMDAYKRAIQLDAIANTESTLSQQYMEQLQSTAPGNAALVQAQAAAWNVQAAAYTQQGLAELLRVDAAENAYQSFKLKQEIANHSQVLQKFGISQSN